MTAIIRDRGVRDRRRQLSQIRRQAQVAADAGATDDLPNSPSTAVSDAQAYNVLLEANTIRMNGASWTLTGTGPPAAGSGTQLVE